MTEKICIAIPSTGQVTIEWAWGFKLLDPPVPSSMHYTTIYSVGQARNQLVKEAQEIGASHIFFIDSDVIVPPDGLRKLWGHWKKHKFPILSGQYRLRHDNSTGILVEQNRDGEILYANLTEDSAAEDGLISGPGLAAGLGCCLIHLDVFNHISKPYFFWDSEYSEDLVFFKRAKETGFQLHIDRTVKCAHIDKSFLDCSGQRLRLTAKNIVASWQPPIEA